MLLRLLLPIRPGERLVHPFVRPEVCNSFITTTVTPQGFQGLPALGHDIWGLVLFIFTFMKII